MSATNRKLFILMAVLVLALIALSLAIEPFLSSRINPAALTRHAIEECERVEKEVLAGIANGILPSDLRAAYGAVLLHSTTFRGGYIEVSDGAEPITLDAWKQPLHIVAKSNLLTLSSVSPRLLSKTNAVVVWSSGPNRSNEIGNGDDIVLPAPTEGK